MITRFRNLYHQLDERYTSHMKIVRFVISGGSAAATDLLFLYIFTDLIGIWYVVSTALAFIVAFGVSFTLQKYWTFRDHSNDRLNGQMVYYFLFSLFNMFLNTFLVYVLVEFIGLHYLPAQVIIGALIAIGSYFFYQKVIFVKK